MKSCFHEGADVLLEEYSSVSRFGVLKVIKIMLTLLLLFETNLVTSAVKAKRTFNLF